MVIHFIYEVIQVQILLKARKMNFATLVQPDNSRAVPESKSTG